jgi:hypothetical protein
MDKGILAKGNRPIRAQSRPSSRQTARTSKTKPQAQAKEVVRLPVHDLLTNEFNPIFDELLMWMQRVQHLSATLRATPLQALERQTMQDELEWLLTQIEVRSGAIVEQLEELSD